MTDKALSEFDILFNQAVNVAVADHFVKVLDEQGVKFINSCLSEHNARIDRLSEEPERLIDILSQLFGSSTADVLAKIALNAAYRSFGIEPDNLVQNCGHNKYYLKIGLHRLRDIVIERTCSQSNKDLR